MSEQEELPEKRHVARELLVKGSVMVHLDPRRDGVAVPLWLRKQPQLVLQIGLDLPVPIPNLLVDDAGVEATLSFNRTPFFCRVPWDAVFALVGEDGQGLVWPDSFPTEIRHEVEREAGKRPAPGLRLVDDEMTEVEDTDAGPDEPAKSGGRERPRLRPITEPIFKSDEAAPTTALALAPSVEAQTPAETRTTEEPTRNPDDDDPGKGPGARHLRLIK